jgi:2-keto-3-deoxy-L-rhamnonate aldolase
LRLHDTDTRQVPTFFASQSASNYDPVNNPLDLETQTKHSLFLVKGGVRGLVILGSTGEAIHLTNKERNELISNQRKEQDRPIIAGTATQNVEETLIQLEDAKKAGAEYGMVLTPGYFASAASQQGIAKWFEAVADKSPIPIMM